MTVGGETRVEVLRSPQHLFAFEAELFSRTIAEGATEAPFPALSPADSLGNAVVLDRWRAELGGVDRTWGSCGAFSVCDGQPTIENCGPCDGYSVSPFGRPTHPPALSHAGIGNVIN